MEQVKQLLDIVFGSRLVVSGKGRTFAKLPMWVAVLGGLCSLHLVLVTVLLIGLFWYFFILRPQQMAGGGQDRMAKFGSARIRTLS